LAYVTKLRAVDANDHRVYSRGDMLVAIASMLLGIACLGGNGKIVSYAEYGSVSLVEYRV
jgi:hypothetical protein